jgi:hypothetical protein
MAIPAIGGGGGPLVAPAPLPTTPGGGPDGSGGAVVAPLPPVFGARPGGGSAVAAGSMGAILDAQSIPSASEDSSPGTDAISLARQALSLYEQSSASQQAMGRIRRMEA